MSVVIKQFHGWFYFLSGNEGLLKRSQCGKWMYFYEASNQRFAKKICKKAIEENVCFECKCTDIARVKSATGVVCFYTNGDDINGHNRIIRFMLENDLIKKTKTGRLYNISFKYDSQTRLRLYGTSFKGTIKLEDLVDLKTGIMKY